MPQSQPIAVIGLSCRYPGAQNSRELWENVLATRRQFRRIPDCRFPLADYYDPVARDKTYATRVAVMDWTPFDYEAHGVSKSTFESTDAVHWLALQVALEAVADAGYSKGTLPRAKTGVILGNTLCGEETRTWGIRLRWPFIARALDEAARRSGLSGAAKARVLEEAESVIKSVFPSLTEDSLNGSMASTIAGRIASYFDVDGGGYVVDGACSSSLLAVATAAERLTRGELDLAIVGGVDISLDPLEMIGFSGAGALTRGDMSVYDRRASGFIPGEGCGVLVLKRLEEAKRDRDPIHAVLRGVGISSDGRGAIAAPNSIGQSKAILRAYEHAGYGPHDLHFVEGHGTGTPVGDRAELEAVHSALRTDRDAAPASCGITSLKSIVGHTKAAAGVGGLIKAIIAVNQRVLPPTAGCTSPHVLFEVTAPRLYPLIQGEVKSPETTLRAGISAMGFGGINCHLTVESADAPPDARWKTDAEKLLTTAQETELFLLGDDTKEGLLARITALRADALGASIAELTDLAAELAAAMEGTSPAHRLAIVAHNPDALVSALDKAKSAIEATEGDELEHISTDRRVMVRTARAPSRIGMVFPGQGSQQLNAGQQLVRRLPWARELLERADRWMREIDGPSLESAIFRNLAKTKKEDMERFRAELTETSTAQPAICLGSLLFAKYLQSLGLEPVAVAGHSLGELSAFAMAGAFGEEELLKLAALRGRAMSSAGGEAGTMASLMCNAETAESILAQISGYVVVANINTPSQTVISGEVPAVEEALRLAEAQGIAGKRLPVSNAFHSRLVAGAAEFLRAHAPVKGAPRALERTIVSSMTGAPVSPDVELSSYFSEQVLARVDYVSALRAMNESCDLLLEVGPGRVLSGMAADVLGPDGAMCLPVESSGGSDRDLNTALAAVFVHGHDLRWRALFDGRFVRPFVPVRARSFFVNPCERPYAPATRDHDEAPAVVSTPWTESLGVPASFLAQYLADRGEVVSALIRADLQRLGAIDGEAAAAPPTEATLDEAPELVEEALDEHAEESVEEDPMEWHPSGPARQSTEIEDSIIEVIAGRMECSTREIRPEARLMDDLRLDVEEAEELVRFAAEFSEVEGLIEASEYRNATIHEVAHAVRRARQGRVSRNGSGKAPRRSGFTTPPPGLPSWVRNFSARVLERSARPASGQDDWATARVLVLADAETADPVARALEARLSARGARVHILPYTASEAIGRGRFTHTFAVLPRPSGADGQPVSVAEVRRSIERLRAAAYVSSGPNRFARPLGNALVLIELGAGLEETTAAFAASLALERPQHRVRVLELAPRLDAAFAAELAIDEAETAEGLSVAVFDAHGARSVPRTELRARPDADVEPARTWSANDVVWVTGGARGRTAECALALAKATGVRLALVDRTGHPVDERARTVEIRRNLERFAEAGVTARYFECDVENLESVREAVARAHEALGPITAMIHGLDDAVAGLPAEHASGEDIARRAVRPVVGLSHVLASLRGQPIELGVALTSLAGVTGLPGGAWPAVANAMSASMLRAAAQTMGMRTLSIAFGPWFELAPAEKPRSTGISPAEGGARFVELFQHDPATPVVVVTARPFGLETWATLATTDAEPSVDHGERITEERGVDAAFRWAPPAEPTGDALAWLEQLRARLDAVAARVARQAGLDPNTLVAEHLEIHRPIEAADLAAEVQVSVVLDESESARTSARTLQGSATTGSNHRQVLFSARYALGAEGRREAVPSLEALFLEAERRARANSEQDGADDRNTGALDANGEDLSALRHAWPMLERDTPAGRGQRVTRLLAFTDELVARLAAQGSADEDTRRVTLSISENAPAAEVVEGALSRAEGEVDEAGAGLVAEFSAIGPSGSQERVAHAELTRSTALESRTPAQVVAARTFEVEAADTSARFEPLGRWLARTRDRYLHELAAGPLAHDGVELACESLELERSDATLEPGARVRVELAIEAVEQDRLILEATYLRVDENGATETIARARQTLASRALEDGAPRSLPESVATALAGKSAAREAEAGATSKAAGWVRAL